MGLFFIRSGWIADLSNEPGVADPSSAEEFPGTALIFPASLRLVGEGMIPSPAPSILHLADRLGREVGRFLSPSSSASPLRHPPLPSSDGIQLWLHQYIHLPLRDRSKGKRSEPEQNIIFYKPTACSAWQTLIYSLTVTPPEEETWRSADVRAQKKGEVLWETYSRRLKPEDIGEANSQRAIWSLSESRIPFSSRTSALQRSNQSVRSLRWRWHLHVSLFHSELSAD